MTTYSFPAIVPTTSAISLAANTAKFISPLTGAIQTLDRGGELWIIDLLYRNLTGDNLAVMTAFLVRLNGQQHRFTLKNHAENNRGAFGGTPLVAGASQTGTSLNIDGCSNSITNWIRAGDWFGVNGELKNCVADENSTAGGLATLSFSPRLMTAPADNAAITTSAATGIFMLSASTVKWSNRPGGFSDLSFSALEDIAA